MMMKGQAGMMKDITKAQEFGKKLFPVYKQSLDGSKISDLATVYIRYLLAVCSSEGLGTPKDDLQALIWYKLSADLGYAGAQAY